MSKLERRDPTGGPEQQTSGEIESQGDLEARIGSPLSRFEAMSREAPASAQEQTAFLAQKAEEIGTAQPGEVAATGLEITELGEQIREVARVGEEQARLEYLRSLSAEELENTFFRKPDLRRLIDQVTIERRTQYQNSAQFKQEEARREALARRGQDLLARMSQLTVEDLRKARDDGKDLGVFYIEKIDRELEIRRYNSLSERAKRFFDELWNRAFGFAEGAGAVGAAAFNSSPQYRMALLGPAGILLNYARSR